MHCVDLFYIRNQKLFYITRTHASYARNAFGYEECGTKAHVLFWSGKT